MSEHMIHTKNVTNVTQSLHQNITNVTKQNIASKEIPTIEFEIVIVDMLSIICVLLDTKFHNTLEKFYFKVILQRDQASCEVTNVTTCYGLSLFLTLAKNLIYKDLYVLTSTGSTIINQKPVDSMFALGAVVAIKKWNFPLSCHKRDNGMGVIISFIA